MDVGTLAQWAAVGISLTALFVAWLNRRTNVIQSLDRRIQDIEADLARRPGKDVSDALGHRQDRHDARLLKVEAEMAHLPSKDMIHALELAIKDMQGQLQVVLARVEPIKAISERIQEAMIEGVHK